MFRNRNESMVQRFAQFAVEHQFHLVMQQFRQIRSYGRRQHSNALEDWFLRGRVLLAEYPMSHKIPINKGVNVPVHLQPLFDMGHDGVQEWLHLASYCCGDMPNSDECCGYHGKNDEGPTEFRERGASTHRNFVLLAFPAYLGDVPLPCVGDVLRMFGCRKLQE